MTDEELIARLRQHDGWVTLEAHTHLTAAHRIEALLAKVKLMDDLDAINGEKIEALEAKVAKAVEAMRETLDAIEGYNQTLPDEDGLYWDGANAGLIAQEIVSARATLAKIKGETK